jgi:asparagine synthase (glutamine-hydrolysing)
MTADLARRGPDSEGIEVWDGVVLGHRRLSIFDLSDAGRQPMLSSDRAVGVVFNGAIYNFRPLRSELESRGFRFHTSTDTEVLLHGYRAWGIDGLLERIRGMYAFGIWDNRARKLFLVRDRLGVKPLVYRLLPDGVAFASTITALRSAGVAGNLDELAITDFLEFGYVGSERSIYQNVRKLNAGSLLEWSPTACSVRQYWTPPEIEEMSGLSFDDAVVETRRLFLRSVERRLDADVPIGALLSGGIDSSLVCWAISKLGADITAFTIGTPGDASDETEDARATAQSLGIRHRVLEMHPNDPVEVDTLIDAYDEPFACASALGMLKLSETVKRVATVLLTGDGGDDVFLGYPRHKHLWLAQKYARVLPRPLAGVWHKLGPHCCRMPILQRPAHFLNYATGGLGAFLAAADGLPYFRRNGLLGGRLQQLTDSRAAHPWSIDSAKQALKEFIPHHLNNKFVAEYMTKVDGGTMYHALEARSPFLDQDLWEFAHALPFSLRLHRGRLKAILRELSRREIGPRVGSGPKRGFSVPVERWLAGPLRSKFQEYLGSSILHDEGWIRSDGVLRLLDAAVDTGRTSTQLWYIFVLESWMRKSKGQLPVSGSFEPAGAFVAYSPMKSARELQ